MKFLDSNEMKKWLEAFDIRKYPPNIYEQLVFDNYQSDRKYEVLGAWKTGCLRLDPKGDFFTDLSGDQYSVTRRWGKHCPVGYDTWHYISENAGMVENQIPDELPSETPEMLQKLIERSGFGFVWALFVAHSYNPAVYPLYDQHVYRAYKFIQSDGKDNPATAPANWAEYVKYCDFFNAQMKHVGMTQIDCDRALWAYGKFQKLKKKDALSSQSVDEKPEISKGEREESDEWVHSITLGSRKKSFWWYIDDKCNLTISRKFNLRAGEIRNKKVIKKDEIEGLLKYLNGFDNFYLRNNVERLANGTEKKDGIGYFLHNQLGWNPTQSQLASHIAAIFSYAGVWANNGNVVRIEFWKNSDDNWCDLITGLYIAQMTDD